MIVNEDWRTWILPDSMKRYDSIIDWWQDLIDGNIHRRVNIESRERLLELAETYEQLSASAIDGKNTVPNRSRIRTVLREICQHGLDSEQAARFLSITQTQLIEELYCNQGLYPEEVTVRISAEQMLRNGATIRETAESTGLTRDQVATLAEIFGLEPTSPRPSDFPQEVRDQAIAMRLQGMENKAISDVFASQGITVQPSTISQWWRRHNQRTKDSN